MTRYAESRADDALNNDAHELMAAFLAAADVDTVKLIASMIKSDETERGELLYQKMIEYVDSL